MQGGEGETLVHMLRHLAIRFALIFRLTSSGPALLRYDAQCFFFIDVRLVSVRMEIGLFSKALLHFLRRWSAGRFEAMLAREARQPGHYVLHIIIPAERGGKIKFTLALQQTLRQG